MITISSYNIDRNRRALSIRLDITTTKPKPTQDKLTATERQAIGQLKQRQYIILKPADKGSGTEVMDMFLNKLLTIGNFPANPLLVTLDVSSLFSP